jgi:hypothetical protein
MRFWQQRLVSACCASAMLFIVSCGGGSGSAPPHPSPSFLISVTPQNPSLAPGTSLQLNLTLQPRNGFAGTATVTIGGLPSSVTTSPSPSFQLTTSGGQSASQPITLTAASTNSIGSYSISFSASSGAISSSVSVPLVVASFANFSVTVSPSQLTLLQGSSSTASVAVGLNSTGAMNYAVQLSASSLPQGVTAAFTPNPVAPNASATMTFTTAVNAPKSFNIQSAVQGLRTEDQVSRSSSLLLNVVPPPGNLQVTELILFAPTISRVPQ